MLQIKKCTTLYFLYIELLSLKNLLSIVTMHIKLMIIYFLNDLYCKHFTGHLYQRGLLLL